jgi:hypothetical protein
MTNNIARALVILGAGFILSVGLIGACALTDRAVPDVLQNLAVGSMGMIGALLVSGSHKDDETPRRPDTPG